VVEKIPKTGVEGAFYYIYILRRDWGFDLSD
jgi:hypothetical protein